MKVKKKNTIENLFLQTWLKPITKQGLLAKLGSANLHTLMGLASFIDKKGFCYPSLSILGKTIGISQSSTVSRRIKKLEKITFQGEPIIIVKREKIKIKNGKFHFSNNKYFINTKVISIFNSTQAISNCRKGQMENFQKARLKTSRGMSFLTTGKGTNKL